MNFINIDNFGQTFVTTMTDLDKKNPGLVTNATETQLQVKIQGCPGARVINKFLRDLRTFLRSYGVILRVTFLPLKILHKNSLCFTARQPYRRNFGT